MRQVTQAIALACVLLVCLIALHLSPYRVLPRSPTDVKAEPDVLLSFLPVALAQASRTDTQSRTKAMNMLATNATC